MSTNFNGICYQPFPPGYDPSLANNTLIFFGSDIAYDPMAPIWGDHYTSKGGSSCNLQGPNKARNDIQTLQDMGVTLIRLYDWDPRNPHLNFLDYCEAHNIKVLVPVSNYFLLEGLPLRNDKVPDLIRSFSNRNGTDYHSAIAGIIIGNEPRVSHFTVQDCIAFTTTFAEVEASKFSSYKELPIGHPVDFNTYGGAYPCFGFWDTLLASLNNVTTKNLNKRLFLAPQTYNQAEYLFKNAEGSGKGYVDLTYEKYQKPILFTEIGYDRTNSNYQQVVQGQLSESINYAAQNPNKLVGICFFQFADKVWKAGTSEGSFGANSQGDGKMCTINYVNADFTHWDSKYIQNIPLNVNNLVHTPLYDIVVKNYKKI